MSDKHQLLRTAAAFHRDMMPTKKSADAMLSHLGQIMSTTAEGAFLNDLPSAVGQPMLEHLGKAITATLAVRAILIKAHIAAKDIGREVLPELAWGDSNDTQTKGSALFKKQEPPLRVVRD